MVIDSTSAYMLTRCSSPPEDVSIIGGGWSAKNIDLANLPGLIICVNDAAMHAPRCDVIVSMDRLWLENRWAALEYLQLPTFVRLSAMYNMLPNLKREWVNPFENRHERSEFGSHPCTLHGPNSGQCALNLGWILRPRRIHLVGFDMGRAKDGESYWFPAYSWAREGGATSNKRYAEWATSWKHGLQQCRDAGIEVIRLGGC